MSFPLLFPEYTVSPSDSEESVIVAAPTSLPGNSLPGSREKNNKDYTASIAQHTNRERAEFLSGEASLLRVKQAGKIPRSREFTTDNDSDSKDPDWDLTQYSEENDEADSDNSEDPLWPFTESTDTASCVNRDPNGSESGDEGSGSDGSFCSIQLPHQKKLRRALTAQQEEIELRRAASLRLCGNSSGQKSGSSDRNMRARSEHGKTAKQVWWEYCRTLTRKFLTDESILVPQGAPRRESKRALFSSVLVKERNCLDMKLMYETKVATKIQMGQPVGSYNLFRCSVGQFLRVYILFHPGAIDTLWQEGALFGTVTDMKPVQAFVNCFQIGASPTTVQSKTAQLVKVAICAGRYFAQKGNTELKGRAETVTDFLNGVSAAFKRESRAIYRNRNTLQSRIERGAHLAPDDFQSLLKVATGELNDILSLLREVGMIKDGHGDDNVVQFRRKKRVKLDQVALSNIIDKWCINFLVTLIFGGGGQRPQIYAQLQQPDRLDALRTEATIHRKYFLLQASSEKTACSNQLGGVVFPKSLLYLFNAHVNWMKPLLVQRLKSTNRYYEVYDSYLLLHTRTGYPLQALHVTKSLRAFLTRIDPELHHITCMSLRGSYATMMLSKFHKGLIFRGHTRTEFLHFLATCMNTSPAMLENTYASCDTDNFEQIVNEMVRAFERSNSNAHGSALVTGDESHNKLNLSISDTQIGINRELLEISDYPEVWGENSDTGEIV